jgi:toluene monooxygenase system ferredoxin subunit
LIKKEATQMTWIEVIDEDELWDDEMTSVFVDGKDVLLIRINGEIHAFHDRCPHKGTPLGEGALHDGVLTCETHNWSFDACTGCGINPSNAHLTRFKVKTEDGKVYVSLTETKEAVK